jgi:hypothetical protein
MKVSISMSLLLVNLAGEGTIRTTGDKDIQEG